MAKKRFRFEDIIAILREGDIHISQGKKVLKRSSCLAWEMSVIIACEKNTVGGHHSSHAFARIGERKPAAGQSCLRPNVRQTDPPGSRKGR